MGWGTDRRKAVIRIKVGTEASESNPAVGGYKYCVDVGMRKGWETEFPARPCVPPIHASESP
jgi:hypothetical protein